MFCKICFRPNAKCHNRFGGIGCHACAAFFRRNFNFYQNFICLGKKGKCLKEPSMRGLNCKKCRFEKCVEFGMKIPEIKGALKISETGHESPKVLIPDSPEYSLSSSESLPTSSMAVSISPSSLASSSTTPTPTISPPLLPSNNESNQSQKFASTIDTLLETAVKYPNLLELYLFNETPALLNISAEILKYSSQKTERIYFLTLLFEKYPITFDELEIVCSICICKFELPWLPQIQQIKIKDFQQICFNRIKKFEENRFLELITLSQNCLNIFGALLKLKNFTNPLTIAQTLNNNGSINSFQITIEEHHARHDASWLRVKEASKHCSNCKIIPLEQLFCNDGICSIVDKKTKISKYCDPAHITTKTSIQLTPLLLKAIDEI